MGVTIVEIVHCHCGNILKTTVVLAAIVNVGFFVWFFKNFVSYLKKT